MRVSVTTVDRTECCTCDRIRTRRDTAEGRRETNVHKRAQRVPRIALALSVENNGPARSQYQLGGGSNPARAVIRHLYATAGANHIVRQRYAATLILCAPRSQPALSWLRLLTVTVTESTRRGPARTPHELSSSVLMRFAYSSRAVAITLTSAHRQRVGRRPERPLNAARSAVEAGACARSCKTRTLDFAQRAITRCIFSPFTSHRD